MTESHRPRVLLVTRNLPPLVGGMERLNWHMAEELAKAAEVRIVGPDGSAALAPAGIEGREAPEALAHAVGGLYETVAAARDWGAPELPIVAMGARLMETSPAVRTERLA